MAKVPYELLVRWNHITGATKGAHVIYAIDGVIGDAQPLALGGSEMQAVVGTALTNAASDLAAAQATIAERDATIAQAEQDALASAIAFATTTAQCAALTTALAAANAELDALKSAPPPPTEDEEIEAAYQAAVRKRRIDAAVAARLASDTP